MEEKLIRLFAFEDIVCKIFFGKILSRGGRFFSTFTLIGSSTLVDLASTFRATATFAAALHLFGNPTFKTSAALDNAASRSVFWLPGFNP